MQTFEFKEISEEIFYGQHEFVAIGSREIERLKQKALTNKRKRVRICAHKDTDDSVHEMIIVHVKGNYVPPHKHVNKSESYHIIEGSADLIFFDDEGEIAKVVPMGDLASGRTFYYRVPEGVYHTLMITSDFIVFHETTKGPLDRSETVFSSWAPDENDTKMVKIYLDRLRERKESIS